MVLLIRSARTFKSTIGNSKLRFILKTTHPTSGPPLHLNPSGLRPPVNSLLVSRAWWTRTSLFFATRSASTRLVTTSSLRKLRLSANYAITATSSLSPPTRAVLWFLWTVNSTFGKATGSLTIVRITLNSTAPFTSIPCP